VVTVGVMTVLALLAGACSKKATETGQPATTVVDEGPPKTGGTLKVGITTEADGYNPAVNRWDPIGNLVGSTIFDSLTKLNADHKIEPNLAQAVTPNADGTSWTITLRSGITFQNGEPMDAAAVKLNLDARRADAIAGGALEPIGAVNVQDAATVIVVMKRPWFGFDALLAAQTGDMAAPATINDPEGSKHPIGTGPFIFVKWVPGSTVQVQRNPGYWQSGKPYLDGITFSIVPDQTTLVTAVRAGDVDLAMTDDAGSIQTLRAETGLRSIEDAASETSYVQLQEAAPPFDNKHARLALAYATNQQDVIDVVGSGVTPPAVSPFSEKNPWHVADAGYVTFDPEKARAELDLYRQETGQAKLSFTLRSVSGGAFGKVAQALQAQWGQVGIETTVQEDQSAGFLADTFFGKFQAELFRNFGFVNPDSDYLFWHSSQAKGIGHGSINFTQTKVPAIDQGMDGARSTNDDTARKQFYDDVQRALNAELPYIWLYHNVWALVARPDVGGLSEPQKLGFGRTDAKPWWGDIWMKS
jgi:peptide/nickel transport system substrate-binding protein